jgi:[ribosomal protein S18]-alanine N-acetyltransferase
MKIRKADQSDLAQIVEIEELCFPEETAFPPRMFAYLIRYSVALVACGPEEEVAGFIMGYTSGDVGAVYTLDVHPLCRRRGIGTKLILALEEKLSEMGARLIRLEAALENPGSMELYHKAGYEESEMVRNYYGRGKHAVRMWKKMGGVDHFFRHM